VECGLPIVHRDVFLYIYLARLIQPCSFLLAVVTGSEFKQPLGLLSQCVEIPPIGRFVSYPLSADSMRHRRLHCSTTLGRGCFGPKDHSGLGSRDGWRRSRRRGSQVMLSAIVSACGRSARYSMLPEDNQIQGIPCGFMVTKGDV